MYFARDKVEEKQGIEKDAIVKFAAIEVKFSLQSIAAAPFLS